MKNKLLPLDFNYLLLEYYKELEISDDELIVLLISNHLIMDNNYMLTLELLELKVNMPFNRLDAAFSSLLEKKYIIFETINNDFVASLKNLYFILFSIYKKDIMSVEESESNEENEKTALKIISLFERYFQRSLSPIESEKITQWVNIGIEENIIVDSLKDAYNLNSLSISKIDKIILNKLKENE